MIFQVITLIIITSNRVIASSNAFTREEGQGYVFMFNISTNIKEVTWGVQDGDQNEFKVMLITVDSSGAQPNPHLDSASYAGRVSFVGNLTKGHAWFKITNLNINDTNQYIARIINGDEKTTFQFAQLFVIRPVIPTTVDPSTTNLKPTGTLTQEPTTNAPTNPPILKNLTTTLEVKREWEKDMADNTSPAFRHFASEFQAQIKASYQSEENFKNVTVIRLREGSILVTFVVFFKREISREDACAPLENATKGGTLGDFQIVPGSLGCSQSKPYSPRPPGAGTALHPGIIAGLAVVGVLAIAGLVIAILFVCRKKSSRKDYRSSTGGEGYEMDGKHGEPEEQYASVQRPAGSGTKQPHGQQLPQYAAVDKSKKTKKNTREPGELVYADLDHGRHASVGTRPPSDRPVSGSDTVYADIQSDRQKQRHPPPQYGNMQDISYA